MTSLKSKSSKKKTAWKASANTKKLTPKQKYARDMREAHKAEREARRARAEHDWARAARDEARAKRDVAKARAALAGLGRPGSVADGWILGRNDTHGTCAAAAVANLLLAQSGWRVADDDVLRLHLEAGGTPDGAPTRAVLAALTAVGLAGIFPAAITPVQAGGALSDGPGLLVELPCAGTRHAAAVTPAGLITWGRPALYDPALVTAAWRIHWG